MSLLLRRGADPNLRNRRGETALHLATDGAHAAAIEALLDEGGADGNIADPDGTTPLMIAARAGHFRCARLLLEHGAAVDRVRVLDGTTALHYAAIGRSESHAAIVETLCARGADPNAKDHCGRTPLFRAAMAAGELADPAVSLLLDHGARVDETDAADITLLMHAASEGLPELVRGLIELGADVKHINVMGCRASDYAERRAKLTSDRTVQSEAWRGDACWLMLTRKREELLQTEGLMPLINEVKEKCGGIARRLAKSQDRADWRVEEDKRLEDRYDEIVASVKEEVLKARVGSVIAAMCDCLAEHEPLLAHQKQAIAELEKKKRDCEQTIQLLKMKAEMAAAMGT